MMGLALFAGAMTAAATLLVVNLFLLMKAVLWLVLLPFRLLFLALALPLLLINVVVGIVGGVLLATFLAIGGVLVAILLAVVAPLLPLALLVLGTWALFRLMKRPAAA